MTTRRTAAHVLPALGVAALAGALIAAQSSTNGDLAVAGAGPLVAGWLSYLGTVSTVAVLIALRRRVAATLTTLRRRGRWWWFAIGVCGMPIVLASAYGVPIVGVALMSVGSVSGQTVAGLVLDARGFGVPARLPLTGRRAMAAVTAIGGLVLAMVAGSGGTGVGPATAAMIGAMFFAAGATLAVQNAGNGAVAQASGDPMIAGLASALGGTVALTVVLAAVAAGGGLDGVTLPTAGRLYLGGPLGAAIVVAAAWAVRHLGTFALTLTVVAGQLVAAVAVDSWRGVGVPWATVGSIAAIVAATVLGVAPRRRAARARTGP